MSDKSPMLNSCYIGDMRDGLRQFSDAGHRAQVCVTSPPYWGLRDYGIEANVWGGLHDCEHVWGDEITIHKGGPSGETSGLTNRGAHQARSKIANIQAAQFCQCGAWLGTLGLEPDFRMYIDHIVEVMELVRQVLADDGTLWLNLGDSYANDGKWGGETGGKQAYLGEANRKRVGRQKRKTGLKPKDLCLMPARVAIALQEAGWWVRQDIIWSKPNPMPESVTDRCTKTHEYLFLLSKSARYYYDADAIKEPASEDTHARYARGRTDSHKWADGGPGNQTIAKGFEHMCQKPVSGWDTGFGSHSTIEHNPAPKDEARRDQGRRDSTKFGRGTGWRRKLAEAGSGIKNNDSFDEAMAIMPEWRNKRSVWTVTSEPYPEAHFATFPCKLIEPCILAGSRPGDIVLDPFMGSGTTAQVAEALGRRWYGCEINPEYEALQRDRLRQQHLSFD